MTISNTLSSIIAAGNSAQTVFQFPFVADQASDLVVTLISANSVSTTLSPSLYSVSLNSAPTNQIWGVGGTVTYPLAGSAITTGTYLEISRVLPYQQNISVQNQGNYYAQVTEQALDILQMQIQQLATAVGNNTTGQPPYVFVCGPVSGTANALVVSSTLPTNFSLNIGTLITFQPSTFNTGNATLNVLGTGAFPLQRLSPNGPINVTQGDLPPSPLFAQFTGSTWYVLSDIYSSTATVVNTATALSILTTFIPYVTSAPVTFTVAQTTTLPIFWSNEINANGGAATITPNAADSIVVNGATLAPGTSFTIPAQNSAKLYTDGNGHLYLNYLSPTAASAQVSPPQGRLTLSSTLAVQTSDITAQPTIYYLPYVGVGLPIWNGSSYVTSSITNGLSLALDSTSAHSGYHASGNLYDCFAFLNSGSPTLGTGPAWASTTSRTSALTQLNGLWTNASTIAIRYGNSAGNINSGVPVNQAIFLGTMYATADGQTGNVFKPAATSGGNANIVGLCNAYNLVKRKATSRDSTPSWTYGTSTWRPANNSIKNSISYIDVLGTIAVTGTYCIIQGSTNTNNWAAAGVSRNSTGATPGVISSNDTISGIFTTTEESFAPLIGYNTIYAMESHITGGNSAKFWGLDPAIATFQSQNMNVSLEY